MTRKYLLSTFMDTHEEVHAMVSGIYCGLTEWKGLSDIVLSNPDVKSEPHYAYGGYIIGTFIRLIIIVTLVKHGADIGGLI